MLRKWAHAPHPRERRKSSLNGTWPFDNYLNQLMKNQWHSQARSHVFFAGRCDPRKRRTKRDRRSKSLERGVGLGCRRLYCERFQNIDISQILELQNWFFFGKEITFSLSVRRWMCIRASEESLSCAASITFLLQKTADILNYAQRQRATSKTNNAYLHLLQAQVDVRSILCNRPLPSSKTLAFKMRLGAQPFLWKWVLFAWEWKRISISKAEHLTSFWNRGLGELGNGLLALKQAIRKREFPIPETPR